MQYIYDKIDPNNKMNTRECPYCHNTISIKRCFKYLIQGTNYSTICNHCNRSVKLEKEAFPIRYGFFAGFMSIFIPMNVCLYYFKLPFMQSLYYTFPFILTCLVVVSIVIFKRLFFKQDIDL